MPIRNSNRLCSKCSRAAVAETALAHSAYHRPHQPCNSVSKHWESPHHLHCLVQSEGESIAINPSTPPPLPTCRVLLLHVPKMFFPFFRKCVRFVLYGDIHTHTTRKHILNEKKSIEILKVAIEKVLQQNRKLPHTPHRHNHHHTTNETIKHTIRIERESESERAKGASKSEKRKNQINFQNKNVFIRFGNYSAFYLSFHLSLRNHVESTASD